MDLRDLMQSEGTRTLVSLMLLTLILYLYSTVFNTGVVKKKKICNTNTEAAI